MSPEAPLQETITAQVKLSGPDWELQATVTIPKGPIRARQLLPMVQNLGDTVVNAGVQMVEAEGKQISCKAGCGACCRQLVPISETEARNIRDVVEAMPEPRRATIRARFAAARAKLSEAGLFEKLLHPENWAKGDGRDLGITYFRQGIPCPFLEEESCSIYPDRPVGCREYLVTSPAEHCAKPSRDLIEMVPMPLKVWTALARLDPVPAGSPYLRWVPLILAPEWAEAHPDETEPKEGPDLAQEFFRNLTQQPVAGAAEDSNR